MNDHRRIEPPRTPRSDPPPNQSDVRSPPPAPETAPRKGPEHPLEVWLIVALVAILWLAAGVQAVRTFG